MLKLLGFGDKGDVKTGGFLNLGDLRSLCMNEFKEVLKEHRFAKKRTQIPNISCFLFTEHFHLIFNGEDVHFDCLHLRNAAAFYLVLAYQTARAVLPELAILDPVVGGLSLLLVAHQVGWGKWGSKGPKTMVCSGQMVGNDSNCIYTVLFNIQLCYFHFFSCGLFERLYEWTETVDLILYNHCDGSKLLTYF